MKDQALILAIGKPDPKVVKRIGMDVARGLSLEEACLLEDPPMSVESFETLLKTFPEFQIIFKRAQAKWKQWAVESVQDGENINGIRFLLERVHRSTFGQSATTQVENNLTINGLPQDMVAAMREIARKKNVIDVKSEKVKG